MSGTVVAAVAAVAVVAALGAPSSCALQRRGSCSRSCPTPTVGSSGKLLLAAADITLASSDYGACNESQLYLDFGKRFQHCSGVHHGRSPNLFLKIIGIVQKITKKTAQDASATNSLAAPCYHRAGSVELATQQNKGDSYVFYPRSISLTYGGYVI